MKTFFDASNIPVRSIRNSFPPASRSAPRWRDAANALDGAPSGPAMGRVVAGRGHMTLLPVGAAYQFHAERPGVILLQTQEGPDTVLRWADIIQTN